jgi:hypothetical protein
VRYDYRGAPSCGWLEGDAIVPRIRELGDLRESSAAPMSRAEVTLRAPVMPSKIIAPPNLGAFFSGSRSYA